eukprot:TRINITY_DN32155_c0_g1_i1.p1 TRINITY_DN32155_c0_g1~~TRINITY_DN32155_c0_g1_i1.p1  ORF type:complete len:356 (+),score=79.71 TRINITY_DN32155_c0_g1_i1:69-1136(+)
MGNALGVVLAGAYICRHAFKSTNKPVPSGSNFKRGPPRDGEGQVRMLICALDYKRTAQPLSCTVDGRNVEKLARVSGVKDLTVMMNEECTIDNVSRKIREIGARCEDDDFFVFYFSGHGVSVPDHDGDEDDGLDEAFVFCDRFGQISASTCMTDDDFAELMTDSMPKGLRIAVLTDCCHSGTIADFSNPAWDDFEAFSIAGCLDEQTSGDIGRGGIYTHSMLLAVDALQRDGQEEYSAGMLYNATLTYDNRVFRSAQDITIQTNRSCATDTIAWPLVPRSLYLSPLNQAAHAASRSLYGQQPGVKPAQALQANPMLMQQLGIKPQIAAYASGDLGVDIDVEDIDEGPESGCRWRL